MVIRSIKKYVGRRVELECVPQMDRKTPGIPSFDSAPVGEVTQRDPDDPVVVDEDKEGVKSVQATTKPFYPQFG